MKLSQIDELTGIQFERIIKLAFKIRGYGTKTTPITQDFGVDLIVHRNNIKTAIQIKRYSDSVGISAVQEVVAGAMFYKCHHSMVITNATFTKSAYKLAKACKVELIDRELLSNYIAFLN